MAPRLLAIRPHLHISPPLRRTLRRLPAADGGALPHRLPACAAYQIWHGRTRRTSPAVAARRPQSVAAHLAGAGGELIRAVPRAPDPRSRHPINTPPPMAAPSSTKVSSSPARPPGIGFCRQRSSWPRSAPASCWSTVPARPCRPAPPRPAAGVRVETFATEPSRARCRPTWMPRWRPSAASTGCSATPGIPRPGGPITDYPDAFDRAGHQRQAAWMG